MSDAVLIALISLAGVLAGTGPGYITARSTRKKLAAHGEATAEAVRSTVKEALEPVEKRMDQMGTRLDGMADDVADIRTKVAVQEDRWNRAPLRVVESRQQS